MRSAAPLEFEPMVPRPYGTGSAEFFGAARALRRFVAIAALWALAWLTGCAALPPDVRRTPSEVLTGTSSTELARIAEASTPDAERGQSGFRLLPDGAEALAVRLDLAQRAQVSLDVQYYLIAADATGRQFLRALRDAARRGVRVRLLIDDLHADEQEEMLAALAELANVEVRLFNPLPARAGSRTTRVLWSLHDLERINRRMHNKMLIADNTFAVTGGRNIGDAYFMRSEAANFIDMDVLSLGPVVRELSGVFDRYWNSEQAFPIAALKRGGAPGTPIAPGTAPDTPGHPGTAIERFDALTQPAEGNSTSAPASSECRLCEDRIELTFAPAKVFADAPAKAAGATASATASGAHPPPTAMENTLQLMRAARSEVAIASPYFVPGERGLALMREALENGVRISVMTNSLASTDEPLAHWGYARYRKKMLKMGVSLSELSPAHARKAGLIGNFHSSRGRLHAKLAVVDRRWLLVGTMNMDLRSSRSNTEVGLAMDSPELAAQVASLLERNWAASNYRLRVAQGGDNIEWIAADDDREVVHRSEPHADWWLRTRLGLLSLFVAEDLL
jgi:cardiolipin synthase C